MVARPLVLGAGGSNSLKISGQLTVERLQLVWRAFPPAFVWFLGQAGELPPLGDVLDRRERETRLEARDL